MTVSLKSYPLIIGSAAVLTLASCGKKEQPDTPLIEMDTSAITQGLVDMPVMDRAWIKERVVSNDDQLTLTEDEVNQAVSLVEAMGISWESKTGENGNFQFNGVTYDQGRAETMTVSGLYVRDDGTPFFDTLEVTGFESSGEDAQRLSFDRMALDLPDGESLFLMIDFIESFGAYGLYELDETGVGPEANGVLSAGAGYVENMNSAGDDMNMSADFIGWAENDQRQVSILLDNFKIVPVEKDEDSEEYDPYDFYSAMNPFRGFKLDLASLSVQDFSLEYIEGEISGEFTNPFNPNFSALSIQGLKMEIFDVQGELPEFKNYYTPTKNGETWNYIWMPSFEISSTDKTSGFAKYLNETGYNKLDFSMAGYSFLDENNDLYDIKDHQLALRDGFVWGGRYELYGMKAMFDGIGDMVRKVRDYEFGVDDDYYDPTQDLRDAFAPAKVANFEFMYTDNSFIDRTLDYASKETGVSRKTLINQMSGGLSMLNYMVQTPTQKKAVKELNDGILGLLEDGGSMRISMNQSDDYNFASLVDIISELEYGYTDPDDMSKEIDAMLEGLNVKTEHIKN